jgi:hypothetical protein
VIKNKNDKTFIFKNILRIFLKITVVAALSFILFFVGLHIIFYFQHKMEIRENQKKDKDSWMNNRLRVECEKAIARESIRRGNIVVSDRGGPYFNDIVFKYYGLYTSPMPKYIKKIMDSALFKKYGNDFYIKMLRKSDSLVKKKPDFYYIKDLDGYYIVDTHEPEYKCGDILTAYKYIEDSLFKLKLLPLKQNKCCPYDLIVDAIITKKGKLTKVRVLKKLNPQMDSAVVSLLKSLPCDWIPANDGEGNNHNFRKKFYFFFDETFLKERDESVK